MQNNHAPDPVDIEARECVNKIKKAAKRGHEITITIVKRNITAVSNKLVLNYLQLPVNAGVWREYGLTNSW